MSKATLLRVGGWEIQESWTGGERQEYHAIHGERDRKEGGNKKNIESFTSHSAEYRVATTCVVNAVRLRHCAGLGLC